MRAHFLWEWAWREMTLPGTRPPTHHSLRGQASPQVYSQSEASVAIFQDLFLFIALKLDMTH